MELRRALVDAAAVFLGPAVALGVVFAQVFNSVSGFDKEIFDWRWRVLCWVRFGVTYDRRSGADGRRTAVQEALAYSDETYDFEVRTAARRLDADHRYAEVSRQLTETALEMGLRSTPLLVPKYFDIPTPSGKAEAPGACAIRIGMTPVILASASVLDLPVPQRRAVFQHELTHLLHNDARSAMWFAVGLEVALAAVRVLLWLALTPLIAFPFAVLARYVKELVRLWWHRRSERRADQAVDEALRPALAEALTALDEHLITITGARRNRDLWWRLEDLWLSHPSLWNRLDRLDEANSEALARRLTRH